MTDKKIKESLLVVDDEPGTLGALTRFLRAQYEVTSASTGEEAIAQLNERHFSAVLTDLRMNHGDGFSVLEKCRTCTPPIPCIVFTAYGSIETAVEAMRRGAFDFVTKPVSFDRLELLLDRLMKQEALKQENTQLKQKLKQITPSKNLMIGNSKAMQDVLALIEQVAPSRATVLITGESGTGKELVAQMIHTYSNRTGPFVPVHCAALPETLLESELFGHEKGAFTGAAEQRKGRFETASHGTLFLDEIGEVPLSVQVKLLRVLETQTFERLGSSTPLKTEARIVTATNRDLQQMVAEGTFREDLFFRLDVVRIHLPALRERLDDIPALTRFWLDKFAQDNNRGNLALTEDALNALMQYPWPGNIRELRNCIERMVVLSRGDILTLDNVPTHIRNPQKKVPAIPHVDADSEGARLDLQHQERALIVEALERCNGNRTLAAERLGISRRTLHRKLKDYAINL